MTTPRQEFSPVIDASDAPAGRALESLRVSESRYRRLFETAQDGILLLNATTAQIEDVNPYLIEMLGFSHAEFLGKKLWEVGSFADIDQSMEKFSVLRDSGYVRYEDLPLKTKAGVPIQVEFVSNTYECEGITVVQCNIRDITRRKHSEAALLESELRYRSLFQHMLEGYAYCQTVFEQGRLQDIIYLETNAAFEALTGLKDVCGRRVTEVIPGVMGTQPALFEMYGRVALTGKPEKCESFIESLGIWLSIAVFSPQKGRFVAVFDNITKRIVSEQALRSSEAEFRSLAEAVPQIVWIARADGSNTYLNQHWMDYTGHTLEEGHGLGWNQSIHPDDQQRAWVAWQNAAKAIAAYTIEARMRRADGVYRWWLVRGVPMQDAAGNILKWFGTCTDINDLKMAELEVFQTNEALRESERGFREMLGNMELVSLMLDREARITYCNEYLLRLTGWRLEEIIGRNWFDVFVPPDLGDVKDAVFAALLSDKPEARHHENEILTRSGGRRLIHWNNSLLRSGAGAVIGTASVGEDITERREAAHRIAYLNRVYAMLSGISSLIVRARDREELFYGACRIAVKEGGFSMALIGIVDRRAMTIVPVASAGKNEELLSAINKLVTTREIASTTMVARVVREKQSVVSNDSQRDPQVLLANRYADAGVRSMALFPLIIAKDVVGVLALYAGELEFFHDEELKLLNSLSSDIAFGMDYIDQQERLDHLAYYDVMTGLANRSLFLDRVTQYIRKAGRVGDKLVLLQLDLERFKNINDSLGRSAGDALLQQVAELLTRTLGDANLLARVDADHFAVVMPEIRPDSSVAQSVEKLIESLLEHPFRLDDAVFRVAVKVGVALFPDNGTEADTLFRNAEAALKKAKATSERYLLYSPNMNERAAENFSLENQLRHALDNNEFILHYQPTVSFKTGKVTGAEALIRWNDPRTGLVPPGRFISVLEETGLIHPVGRWALKRAIADYLTWCNAGLAAVRIAVNVSALQLRNRGFIAELGEALAVDTRAAKGLELEITESLIMEDVKHYVTSLKSIRAMGIGIAIDDFGTGFSSLRYLAQLPLDTLKIDRIFVNDMTAGPQGLALVSTIIKLAHSLKLKVVAEGVESEEQSHLLRLLNCDEMQGFLFSKPVPAESFEAKFLRETVVAV